MNALKLFDSGAAPPVTLWWTGGTSGRLWMIDQTLLPVDYREIECEAVEQVHEAIRSLRVRGAPAIGVAAAYGKLATARTPPSAAPAPRAPAPGPAPGLGPGYPTQGWP